MIKQPQHISPPQAIHQKLREWQDEIDSLSTFKERSQKAKSAFSAKNKKGNSTFDAIKEKLTEMCVGAKRCAYCEDSVGDEVEHIYPKDLYPQHCFEWNNYVYACGPCNGPKINKFAVFRHDNDQFEIVNKKTKDEAVEPTPGEAAMINPRVEDPMDFCTLDIKDTFKFVIIAPQGSKAYQKADYTFNEVLRLNDQREYLRQGRKSAYGNYKARLFEYNSKKQSGANTSLLTTLIENLKKEAHTTVWKEMQRWHRRNVLSSVDQELNDLFQSSPEALDW